MSATLDALAAVPLFKNLPRRSLDRISRFARERTFQAGDTIFSEAEEGVGFYLVTSGRVEVLRGDARLAEIGPGGFFGEMALLDGRRRSATVRATENTTCLALMRADFLAELRSNPDLAIELLEALSERIRELDARVTI